MNGTRRGIDSMVRRFARFHKHWLNEWVECMWVQMNWFGKILFLPVTAFGLVAVPIVMPPLSLIMFVLTRKPKTGFPDHIYESPVFPCNGQISCCDLLEALKWTARNMDSTVLECNCCVAKREKLVEILTQMGEIDKPEYQELREATQNVLTPLSSKQKGGTYA